MPLRQEAFAFVALGGGDDLPVGGLEAEAEFAGLVGEDLKFGVFKALKVGDGLILDGRIGGVCLHALDALEAATL